MPSGDANSGIGTISHPTYQTWIAKWWDLAHVYEGSGPFLDGTALVAHPREYLDHTTIQRVPETELNIETGQDVPTGRYKRVTKLNPNPKKPSPKLLERRRLARYENVAAPIVDHKLAALFREGPQRRVAGEKDAQDHEWLVWTRTDVDGAGTSLTDFMRDAWRIAAIFGHAIILMDRNGGAEQPRTLAERGRLVLRIYAPADMPDWRQDESGALREVKLLEVTPRGSLRDPKPTSTRLRYVDDDVVEVVDEQRRGGEQTTITKVEHGFGTIPVVVLYAKRRALTPLIGQSVLYDPQLYFDLYNLTSETRELLRKQTFSTLNVPLGTGDGATSVDDAKALIGETIGTANVLFSGQPAQYLSADSSNVTVYQEVIAALMRTIYRLSNVPFESDSKDAEAVASLKLKREDMNQVLAAYGDECERAELALAQLWFRGTYDATWEAKWKAVEPSVIYPDTFDPTPIEEVLERTKAALGLPLGRSKTFMLEMSKQIAPKLLGDVSTDTMKLIEAELDALPDPEEERKARMAALTGAFEQAGEREDDPAKEGVPV